MQLIESAAHSADGSVIAALQEHKQSSPHPVFHVGMELWLRLLLQLVLTTCVEMELWLWLRLRLRLLLRLRLQLQLWFRLQLRLRSERLLVFYRKLLARSWADPAAKALRLRTFELGYAINKTLGGGGHWGGMSVLQSQDPTLGLLTIDTPLNDKAYLTSALKNASVTTQEIITMATFSISVVLRDCLWLQALPTVARKAALAAILSWTDPGEGGFYDQLGSIPRSAVATQELVPTT